MLCHFDCQSIGQSKLHGQVPHPQGGKYISAMEEVGSKYLLNNILMPVPAERDVLES